MTAPQVDDLLTVRCGVCGFRLLVDPEAQAILMHYPDATHRLVGYRQEPVDLDARDEVLRLRSDALALAVRLQDIADDMAKLVARAAGLA